MSVDYAMLASVVMSGKRLDNLGELSLGLPGP